MTKGYGKNKQYKQFYTINSRAERKYTNSLKGISYQNSIQKEMERILYLLSKLNL